MHIQIKFLSFYFLYQITQITFFFFDLLQSVGQVTLKTKPEIIINEQKPDWSISRSAAKINC